VRVEWWPPLLSVARTWAEQVRGTAELIEDYNAMLAIGMAVAGNYNGSEVTGELTRRFLERQAHTRIGVAIEHVASWHHRKIVRH